MLNIESGIRWSGWRSSFRLVGLLLSCESDENLGELLNIGRVTTFVSDMEPSRIGATHMALSVSLAPTPTTFWKGGQVPGRLRVRSRLPRIKVRR